MKIIKGLLLLAVVVTTSAYAYIDMSANKVTRAIDQNLYNLVQAAKKRASSIKSKAKAAITPDRYLCLAPGSKTESGSLVVDKFENTSVGDARGYVDLVNGREAKTDKRYVWLSSNKDCKTKGMLTSNVLYDPMGLTKKK